MIKNILFFLFFFTYLPINAQDESPVRGVVNDRFRSLDADKMSKNKGGSSNPFASIYVSTNNVSLNSNTFTYIPWTEYTATFAGGWGTVAPRTILYRIVGDTMEIRGTFTTGTVSASAGTIKLPTGYAIDSTKTGTVACAILGFIYQISNAGTNLYVDSQAGLLFYASTSDKTVMTFTTNASGLVFTATNINSYWTSGSWGSIYASFPVTKT